MKHRFDAARIRYKGDYGFKRGLGWSVIAQNLVSIARVQRTKKQRIQADEKTKQAA